MVVELKQDSCAGRHWHAVPRKGKPEDGEAMQMQLWLRPHSPLPIGLTVHVNTVDNDT